MRKGTDEEPLARNQLRVTRAAVRREQWKWETIKGIRNVKKKIAPAVWLEVPDDDDGVQMRKTADREEWKDHLTKYCQKKYVDDKIKDGCIRERVVALRGQADKNATTTEIDCGYCAAGACSADIQ